MNEAFLESAADAAISPGLNWQEPAVTVPASAETVISASQSGSTSQPAQILRFHKSERLLHWSIAIPFMVCYATGFVLMIFFSLRSEGVSRVVLSWIHRGAGTCLIVFPILTAIRYWSDFRIHLHNVKEACTWTFEDLKWLVLMGPAAFSRKITLPDQGKFNAAEKVNFLMVLCTYSLFIATGVLLWLPGTAFLSWVIHVGMALVATPLMFGHIYMALINRDTQAGLSGMFSGYVDRHWAKHHYRRWYLENHESNEKASGDAEETPVTLLSPALIHCSRCPSRSSCRWSAL